MELFGTLSSLIGPSIHYILTFPRMESNTRLERPGETCPLSGTIYRMSIGNLALISCHVLGMIRSS